MTSDTLQHYVVPGEPGRGKAIALAVLVHAMLFALLWVGINWVSQPPESLSVETFTQSELDQAAQEPPQPVAPPKVEDKTPEVPDADINTALKQKKDAEDAARLAAQKKAEEKQKADEEKRQREQEAADRKREEDKKKADEKKQQDNDKKLLDKWAQQDRANMTAGTPSSAATPAKPGGGKGDSAWAGKVSAKIKSLITFNPGPGANPNATVEFDVKLLPDGSVASVNRTKSSGIPAFDEAAERAIKAAAPYPPDKDGVVPRYFPSSHRLGDQQ